MRFAAVRAAGEDDAAVATPEAAAHDLLERDIAGAPVSLGELRAGPHHRRRAAHEQLDRIPQRSLLERGSERRRDTSLHAGAAVLGAQHDGDAKPIEQVNAIELIGAPSAVEESRL